MENENESQDRINAVDDDRYLEDNSFNNQGIENGQIPEHVPEQMPNQMPNQGPMRGMPGFVKGFKQGLNPEQKMKMPGKKNTENNNQNANKLMQGQKKDEQKPMPKADKNDNNQNAKTGNDREKKTKNESENKSSEKGGIKNKILNNMPGMPKIPGIGGQKKETTQEEQKQEEKTNQVANIANQGVKKIWAALPLNVKITVISSAALVALPVIAFTIVMLVTGTTIHASMCDQSAYSRSIGMDADAAEFICKMQAPLKKIGVTSIYGWREYDNYDHLHNGVDLEASCGTEVYAAGDGEVIDASTTSGYGNHVQIKHGDKVTTYYAHLQTLKVKKGDTVKAGTVIGLSGKTGGDYACHLHFEVRNGTEVSDGISPNIAFGYSDQGYDECLDRNKAPTNTKCGIDATGASRKIKEDESSQSCMVTPTYTAASGNNSCCGGGQSSNSNVNASLAEFVKTFEGAGGYCDSAKTKYKAYQNAGDRITIGFGVTNDHLPSLTHVGQCIEVSKVDEASLKALEKKWNGIQGKFEGANLTQYQQDAMTSMAYNGCASFFDGIASAAKKGDYKGVWSAMKDCKNTGTQFETGLKRRRKAEFALYVTGDYTIASTYKQMSWSASQYNDYNSDGVMSKKGSGNGGTISGGTCSVKGSTDIVERANQEYEKWNKESTTGNERSDMVRNYMDACGSGKICDDWCAGFVSYILQETGKKENLEKYNCMAVSYKNVEAKNSSISVTHHSPSGYTPQPGDIFVQDGHVGLVEYVEGQTIHTIEGNTSGKYSAPCWQNGYSSIGKGQRKLSGNGIIDYVTIK